MTPTKTLCSNCESQAAEIVTLREALKKITIAVSPEPMGSLSGMANRETRNKWYLKVKVLRGKNNEILDSITSYKDKVVVDKELIAAYADCLEELIYCGQTSKWKQLQARLDSLRKGGEG